MMIDVDLINSIALSTSESFEYRDKLNQKQLDSIPNKFTEEVEIHPSQRQILSRVVSRKVV